MAHSWYPNSILWPLSILPTFWWRNPPLTDWSHIVGFIVPLYNYIFQYSHDSPTIFLNPYMFFVIRIIMIIFTLYFDYIYIPVGGLDHFFISPYIENNTPNWRTPNWRTHIFQRGRSTTNQPWYSHEKIPFHPMACHQFCKAMVVCRRRVDVVSYVQQLRKLAQSTNGWLPGLGWKLGRNGWVGCRPSDGGEIVGRSTWTKHFMGCVYIYK